eukprot:m.127628 g.127628  ORF g.127628 m.127628 type:complete len:63 (-) comp14713_c0_seq3:151-339(-)
MAVIPLKFVVVQPQPIDLSSGRQSLHYFHKNFTVNPFAAEAASCMNRDFQINIYKTSFQNLL